MLHIKYLHKITISTYTNSYFFKNNPKKSDKELVMKNKFKVFLLLIPIISEFAKASEIQSEDDLIITYEKAEHLAQCSKNGKIVQTIGCTCPITSKAKIYGL